MGESLSVAVPWSLSHYIPLNGFHPLYRALFDQSPTNVRLHAWDNIRLNDRFDRDAETRDMVLRAATAIERGSGQLDAASVARTYQDFFWPPNQVLTSELIGDLEFHHTAPYPSLERPFVFHCEAFAPVFLPFVQQGSGNFEAHQKLKDHYRRIFASPLCLGIFSHIPETICSLSRFFQDPEIDRKLFSSKIGLSSLAVRDPRLREAAPGSKPKFLFINSAHQNPENFFRRGGHIVLRFWKEYAASGRDGLLILRCTRPCERDLIEHGVDTAFVNDASGRSVIWAEDYLANDEINALMASASFFLLPSLSLHSASILQSMSLGAIPVVTDTIGTSVYVTDDEHGIVLSGVRRALWHADPNTGIPVQSYRRTPDFDDRLVSQMTSRVIAVLNARGAQERMRSRMMSRVTQQFSGLEFSRQFWSAVADLYLRYKTGSCGRSRGESDLAHSLRECTLQRDDWSRVFEGVTQPMRRLYTGTSTVWELGGAFVHSLGNPAMELHDWSVFAQHFRSVAPRTTFVRNLPELGGRYLSVPSDRGRREGRKGKGLASRMLSPFPILHGFAKGWLVLLRRYRRYLAFKWTDRPVAPDVELVAHGVSGYNIIRFFHRYYAIPQNEGSFSLEKARAAGYSSCFSGYSKESVLRRILRGSSRSSPDVPAAGDFDLQTSSAFAETDKANPGKREPQLVDEGYRGFNLVRHAGHYFAILQGDGPFEASRVMEQSYQVCYHALTLEELRGKMDLEPAWPLLRWALTAGGRSLFRRSIRKAVLSLWLDRYRRSQSRSAADAVLKSGFELTGRHLAVRRANLAGRRARHLQKRSKIDRQARNLKRPQNGAQHRQRRRGQER